MTHISGPMLPAGDRRHGLPAGVDASCHCRPCQRAYARMVDAHRSTRTGVPRHRAARRVQALRAIGYSPATLARIVGCSVLDVNYLSADLDGRGRSTVRRIHFVRLAGAYDTLAARPLDDEADPRWFSPAAWDDIDNPKERPTRDYRPAAGQHGPRCQNAAVGYGCSHESCQLVKVRKHDTVDPLVLTRIWNGERVPATKAEREIVTARWLAAGRTWESLERFTGWNVDKYVSPRQKAGTAA